MAAVEGKYPQIPKQWPQVFHRGFSRMAMERIAEMRYTGLAQLKSEGGATSRHLPSHAKLVRRFSNAAVSSLSGVERSDAVLQGEVGVRYAGPPQEVRRGRDANHSLHVAEALV